MTRAGGRLIVALDVPNLRRAEQIANRLRGAVRYVKIGSVLFTAEGPRAVARMRARGFQVFLDLKFHDIPSTVEKSCRSAAGLGIAMLTVHASGGAEMIRAAVTGARDGARGTGTRAPLILGVTVLTSDGAGQAARTRARVMALAREITHAGAQGVVASAQEVAMLRQQFGTRLRLICPGIRPPGAAPGDQQRVATPAEALQHGADFLVVGRPITAAVDPRAAVDAIIRDMEDA